MRSSLSMFSGPRTFRPSWRVVFGAALLTPMLGCATQKESFTARTSSEQLLISSAIEQSLDKIDFRPLCGRRVFLETKYLDCVDKNYLIVSLHQRLLKAGSRLAEKCADAEVVLEVGSGAVGTDGQELFVGVPEIPLPPPSPVAIPRLALLTRTRMNGTAKLLVVAYDARTKEPLLTAAVLSRSNQNNWNVLGAGNLQTGSVPEQIAAATDETDFNLQGLATMAKKAVSAAASSGSNPPTSAGDRERAGISVAGTPPRAELQQAVYRTSE